MSDRATITEAQRAVLLKLAPVLREDFYLVGGVAVAAHLAHRTSRDVDLFATRDPSDLRPQLEHLPGVEIKGRAPGTLHLRVDEIPVSLIEYRYPLIAPTLSMMNLPVPVASIDDLACMKLSAIAGRGAARDFWDLHTIVTRTGRPLIEFMDAFRRKYPIEDIGHVLRSLVYFGDAGDLLPEGLSTSHWGQIQRDFEAWVQAAFETR
ncbi:MAG TPA: nucleotidyl transferase AbiEii/AbiGii toxin family protein [Kofleriaceae bacterium]|nr:nucleotidyl transferase AbiEii/AbiGii toxin family protein [Kofleriaceae bacterium]